MTAPGPPPPPPPPGPPPPPPPGPDPAATIIGDREQLRAELSGRPPASLRPAAIASADPLRPVPGALLAKLEVRQRAGLVPAGADHPRRDPAVQYVFAGWGIAGVAAILLVIGLVTSHHLFALITGLITAAGVLVAVGSWAYLRSDPLRLSRTERRTLTAAGVWQSRQPWTGALTTGPERALLDVAVQTVTRIAADPAWRSGYLDGHRFSLDLAAELDAVDAQAYQVAQARVASRTGPDSAAAFDACLDRVAALRRYDAGLKALATRISTADAQLRAAPEIGQLRGGADQDRYATADLDRLTAELGVIGSAVDNTVAEVRSDRSHQVREN